MSEMTWDTKRVIGVAVLVGALTQIGNGLKAASWLIGVPEAAYAGQEKAKQVDEKFERYLARQDAVAEALNKYVTQQQNAPSAPSTTPIYREWEGDVCWECPSDDRAWCFQEQQWRRCE